MKSISFNNRANNNDNDLGIHLKYGEMWHPLQINAVGTVGTHEYLKVQFPQFGMEGSQDSR